MARDGNGNYNLPQPAFVTGTAISSTAVNSDFADIAAALTGSLAADGQTNPTDDLKMNGHKFTGMSVGIAATDSAHLGQVQAQAYTWATVGGTADAITLAVSPAITAYAAGQSFRFVATADNTGAATVAVSGLAAKSIQFGGVALAAGDIKTGAVITLDYDGTQFQMSTSVCAKPTLGNVLLVTRSESSSFTIGKADNNKTILVTAAATVTEAAGAAACVAGNVIHINNTGTKAGGYLVTVSLTIDGVSGRVLVGGESLTLLALGSGAFRTIAEHIEPWSFWGYNSTARTNRSGDGTEDNIECDTVVHNIGGQLSGRTHTTMASCVCSYAVSISLANLASNHTRLVVTLKRSNGDVTMDYSNPYAQMDPGDANLSKNYCSPKVDQDSGDTATCRYKVVGGSKVVTLNAGKDCSFSGEFIRSLT